MRTTTRRSGPYAERGRAAEGPTGGNSRGRTAYGRSQTGYTRDSNRPRESGYPREPRQSGYPREQNTGSHDAQKPRSAFTRKIPMRLIGIVAALVAAVAIIFIIISAAHGGQSVSNPNVITAGVKINGQDVSGQDWKKLRIQLHSEMQKKIDDTSITLTYGSQSWTMSGADIGETDNVDDVIDNVSSFAHVGTPEQQKAEAQKYKQQGFEATVDITPDPVKLKSKITELTGKVNQPGKDASVSFNWLVNFADPDNPTQDEINSMFKITPEQQGQAVDVDTTAQKIMDALKDSPKCTVGLVVNPFVPKYTADSLKQCEHVLSVFHTSISSVSTKQRIANIKLALSRVNGLTIWPGQEFSFNDTTGPRTASAGYQMAHVISGGTYVDDWAAAYARLPRRFTTPPYMRV